MTWEELCKKHKQLDGYKSDDLLTLKLPTGNRLCVWRDGVVAVCTSYSTDYITISYSCSLEQKDKIITALTEKK